MDEKDLVREYERVDDLQVGGLKIIQNPEGFCFGIDAVLISNFAKVKRNAEVVELGTGTGIIPILIAGKTKAKKITAFEIQEEVAEMASRSVKLNDLEDRIQIINDDLKNVLKHIPKASKDVVISNPPYVQTNGGLVNPRDKKAISRHEVACVLEDVIRAAAGILNVGGSFYMVHRPQRLVDIVYLMRKYKLEPKEIRLVQPKVDKKPNIILVKGVRGGNPELKFLDPLVVYNDDGTYTDEIYDIYSEAKIDVFDGR
jgi:tRNA1Val (adenine37-N6)-methyltransferase